MHINKRIIISLILVSALFLSLITYLIYFNTFHARDIFGHSANRRSEAIVRGNIISSDGVLLAQTITDENGGNVRNYPHGRLYSGVIGYNSPIYGRAGLEYSFNEHLTGSFGANILGNVNRGFDLILTIDHDLQQFASSQLGNRRGAIIAMEPRTGRVLAMVSYPNFDPNHQNLAENWETLVENEHSPLLPRATLGLYPPGSVYKIVTAAAAFEAGMIDRTWNDTGAFDIGAHVVRNHNNIAYGNIDLSRAFAVSSNYVFCAIGYELGGARIAEIARRFGIGANFDFDIPVNVSRLDYPRNTMTNADSALVSMGQGALLVTPLHMAMITSSVANNGVMMQPYIVERSRNDIGLTMFRARRRVQSRPLTSSAAEYLTEIMELAVNDGTGTNAQISGVRVAGKTGTAENELTIDGANLAHTWFVGFAPVENPQIVVVVMLEHSGGTGGGTAATIFRDITARWLTD